MVIKKEIAEHTLDTYGLPSSQRKVICERLLGEYRFTAYTDFSLFLETPARSQQMLTRSILILDPVVQRADNISISNNNHSKGKYWVRKHFEKTRRFNGAAQRLREERRNFLAHSPDSSVHLTDGMQALRPILNPFNDMILLKKEEDSSSKSKEQAATIA